MWTYVPSLIFKAETEVSSLVKSVVKVRRCGFGQLGADFVKNLCLIVANERGLFGFGYHLALHICEIKGTRTPGRNTCRHQSRQRMAMGRYPPAHDDITRGKSG